MADKTAISWCDATFNPWWGCQKVSPACDHCYAERDARRFAAGRVLWGVGSERRTFGEAHWQAPLTWAKHPFTECMACGWRGPERNAAVVRNPAGFHPPVESVLTCPICHAPEMREARARVFCASMGDWLDLDAPINEFVRLLETIRRTPALDWLLLSKRIGNWRKRLEEARVEARCANHIDLHRWLARWLAGDAPANVVLMATVVNQPEADRDIPKLLVTPARRRGLSIEPMLGAVDVSRWLDDGSNEMALAGTLDWVIAGGESGPHARPMHPGWVRSLRDQCAAAGVAFHFKQWGEWSPGNVQEAARAPGVRIERSGATHPWPPAFDPASGDWCMRKIGKAAAGRLLDGVTHDDFPTVV